MKLTLLPFIYEEEKTFVFFFLFKGVAKNQKHFSKNTKGSRKKDFHQQNWFFFRRKYVGIGFQKGILKILPFLKNRIKEMVYGSLRLYLKGVASSFKDLFLYFEVFKGAKWVSSAEAAHCTITFFHAKISRKSSLEGKGRK